MDEANLLGQEGLQLWESLARQIFRTSDGSIDAGYHILQEGQRAVLASYHGFPVPLIHVERVEVIQFLIGADGIHIGVDAVATLHLLLGQSQSFPLCQRVYYLGPLLAHVLDRERHGAFNAVQVVVDTQPL